MIGAPVASTLVPRLRPPVAWSATASNGSVVKVALHLNHQLAGLIPFDPKSLIETRQRSLLARDIQDGASYGNDRAG
jgi:hypothetical protein